MARYTNKIALKTLGEKIKAQRIKSKLKITDLAEMTGFKSNTISNIENGQEISLSYFIEICYALGCHPKEIMDVSLVVTPRYPLSEKTRLTDRIKDYIQGEFFKTARTANEVTVRLNDEHGTNFMSKNVSVVLARLSKKKILRVTKQGNKHLYGII